MRGLKWTRGHWKEAPLIIKSFWIFEVIGSWFMGAQNSTCICPVSTLPKQRYKLYIPRIFSSKKTKKKPKQKNNAFLLFPQRSRWYYEGMDLGVLRSHCRWFESYMLASVVYLAWVGHWKGRGLIVVHSREWFTVEQDAYEFLNKPFPPALLPFPLDNWEDTIKWKGKKLG